MSDMNSSLPVRTENNGDVVSRISDGTVTSQLLTVNPDGSINITDNGASLTVDAVDLDIRDLDSTQDSVEVLQTTHDNLNTNANLQVGDADVANGNPVPVSDAGGSLTVDATDLDIRDLVFATDKVDVTGSDVTATVTATDLDIRDLDATQDNVAISDGTDTLAVNADGSINAVVTATNLDIRDLTHVTDSIKIGDGTDFLAVNADGSINVVPQEDAGLEIVNYDTTAAVAGGASDNHDWTAVGTAKLYQVYASASGKMKIQIQIETGAATNTFNTIAVAFNSTSDPIMNVALSKYAAVPSGARVRVIRTNRDNQAQDVYSTIVAIQG